jgi:hypothetical protein
LGLPPTTLTDTRLLPGAKLDGLHVCSGISMACEDLVVGCFLDDRAPLAVPELNRERTLKYLECCYKQGMSWKDAEQQIQDCLQQRGVPREGILRQLKLARPLLQPWLD